MKTPNQTRVYRFHDQIALDLDTDQTTYLSVEQAEALSADLQTFVKDAKTVSFSQSRLGTKTRLWT